jgi:molecular chaperone GrpE
MKNDDLENKTDLENKANNDNVETTSEDNTEDNQTNDNIADYSIEELQTELIKARELNSSCNEKYIRVHSDFENIKKRMEKDKISAISFANEKFAKDLIPVVDSLEAAINSADDNNFLLEGLNLTRKLFLQKLQSHGVEQVSIHDEFNPNVHNAVQVIDNEEVPSGNIIATLQKGYLYNGRVLREAMVSISA